MCQALKGGTQEPHPDFICDVFGEAHSAIHCCVKLVNVPSSGCRIDWIWYPPSGPQAEHIADVLVPVNGQVSANCSIYLGNELYSDWLNREGQWRVDIYVNGERKTSLPFYMRYVQRQHVMCKDVQNTDQDTQNQQDNNDHSIAHAHYPECS